MLAGGCPKDCDGNMDDVEKVELKYLSKYVLFIEFIIENGAKNYKLKEIVKWIVLNARIKRKMAEQIERILILQYKILLRKNKLLPRWIHELFEDQIIQIELLSSDNEENLESSNPTSESSTKRHRQNINPVVSLEKLSPSQVEQILNKSQELQEKNSAVLDVVLVESSYQNLVEEENSQSETNSNRKIKDVACISNTDSLMTEKNTKFCAICNSKPQNLTNHFIHMHKTESYVSRLSDETLNSIRNTTSFMVPLEEVNVNSNILKTAKLSAFCPFCETSVIDHFMNFYNHFSFHTGEYAYYCRSCKLKKPYRKDILAHQMRSKKCSGTGVSTFYVYSCKQMVINIFRCILCNFVQLNSANISKHIFDHHGNHNEESTIEKLVIAKFDVGSN